MIYVLRCLDNKGFNKSGILNAIKNNRIYKVFRWNFVKKGCDPNVSDVETTNEYKTKSPIRDTILKLNSTKTEILDSYYTKDYAASDIGIGKQKMRNIILNNEQYDDFYYIEYSKCPKELLDKYNKPINRIIPTHSKAIKQINPITKKVIILNSLNEIYIKLGISSQTIIDSIKNKNVCGGYLWEYA